MADVRLDRFFGQVKPLSDFPVDKAVGHELQHFELAGSWLLLELAQDGRSERDDGARARATTACSRRFEAAAVVTVTAEDLLTLRGVHESGIGLPRDPL